MTTSSGVLGGLDQFLFAGREVVVLQRVQYVRTLVEDVSPPQFLSRDTSSRALPVAFPAKPAAGDAEALRGILCPPAEFMGDHMPGNIERAALRAAAQAAEQILANAAERAAQAEPQDPYAQRVAELGMVTGALRALLDAVRPFTEEGEEDGR
ncbi:hypothetical protein [Streptomyces sp. NBC_01571]|uniref:hypothetical protein n=1 Tax=Streptomyces sp. NBC_01571 TaxID=2975883 RepID=UPI002B1CC6E2|nr:hypothetical protein [Streptomyces sp. NBC_01571]